METFKIYRVPTDKVAEQDGDLRVIDESGEDYLFPADYFVRVDLLRQVVHALHRKPPRPLQPALISPLRLAQSAPVRIVLS